MITTLMFHRVHADNLPEIVKFIAFFKQLHRIGENCVPGEEVAPHRLGVCLTFDDAYYDFYHYIYPLLKQYQLRAVLAIPTALIAEEVPMMPEQRLSLQYSEALDNRRHNNPSLCSWNELQEMVDSGWVIPASHGATHTRLDKNSNLTYEVIDSKTTLENMLGHAVNCFVYPYGRFDATAHAFVCKHYRYAMRIGSASNLNWHHAHQLVYRINADDYWPHGKTPFSMGAQAHQALRLLLNFLRRR